MSKIVFDNCILMGTDNAINIMPDNPDLPRDPITVVLQNMPFINGDIIINDANLEITNCNLLNGKSVGISLISTIDVGKYHLTVNGPLEIIGADSSLVATNYVIDANDVVCNSQIILDGVSATFNYLIAMEEISISPVGLPSVVTFNNSEFLMDMLVTHSVVKLNNVTSEGQYIPISSTIEANSCTVLSIDALSSSITLNQTTVAATINADAKSSVKVNAGTVIGQTTILENSSVEYHATTANVITITAGFAGVYGGRFTTGAVTSGGLLAAGISGGTITGALGIERTGQTNIWLAEPTLYLGASTYTQDIMTDYNLTIDGNRTDLINGTYSLTSVADMTITAPSITLTAATTSLVLSSGISTLTADDMEFNGTTANFSVSSMAII